MTETEWKWYSNRIRKVERKISGLVSRLIYLLKERDKSVARDRKMRRNKSQSLRTKREPTTTRNNKEEMT